MTAFASVQGSVVESALCWEIRSVNHRYLDISFRLPEAWRFLEMELRTAIRGNVVRGKVECQLKCSELSATNQAITINESLVDAFLTVADKLAIRTQLPNDLTLSSLVTWPGVVQIKQPDVTQLASDVLTLFNRALDKLQHARAVEGLALKNHIQNRLHRLEDEISKAKTLIAHATLQTRDKLINRLQSLQLGLDPARMEQEIALILTKLDVSEELDRLTTHVQEVANTLMVDESTGRRLDFLMQELNREANTLGSKSDSIALTQCAVEMKVLIEQMREQIQNIE